MKSKRYSKRKYLKRTIRKKHLRKKTMRRRNLRKGKSRRRRRRRSLRGGTINPAYDPKSIGSYDSRGEKIILSKPKYDPKSTDVFDSSGEKIILSKPKSKPEKKSLKKTKSDENLERAYKYGDAAFSGVAGAAAGPSAGNEPYDLEYRKKYRIPSIENFEKLKRDYISEPKNSENSFFILGVMDDMKKIAMMDVTKPEYKGMIEGFIVSQTGQF